MSTLTIEGNTDDAGHSTGGQVMLRNRASGIIGYVALPFSDDVLDRIASLAESQVGTKEDPAGSNNVEYSRWYGIIGPWCAMFVSYVIVKMAGLQFRVSTDKGFAWVPSVVEWAKQHGYWTQTPKRGYLVVFQFGSRPDHVGFVRVTPGAPAPAPTPPAPAPAAPPPDSKAPPFPGRVLVDRRPMMKGSDVWAWQQQMAKRGWRIDVDGVYGDGSRDVAAAFQREKHLEVDGKVGQQTWAAAWDSPVT